MDSLHVSRARFPGRDSTRLKLDFNLLVGDPGVMASIAQIEVPAEEMSVNRRIFLAALSVAGAGVLVKGMAMLK